jgi:hypothetical protein
MDHLAALARARDEDVPSAVRDACRVLNDTPMPGGELVALRTSGADTKVLEAAKDVIAHAYAVVKRHEGGLS